MIFGFCKGYLIIIVLLCIRDDIIRVMKKGEFILMVLVDYLKVFDIVLYFVII